MMCSSSLFRAYFCTFFLCKKKKQKSGLGIAFPDRLLLFAAKSSKEVILNSLSNTKM